MSTWGLLASPVVQTPMLCVGAGLVISTESFVTPNSLQWARSGGSHADGFAGTSGNGLC